MPYRDDSSYAFGDGSDPTGVATNRGTNQPVNQPRGTGGPPPGWDPSTWKPGQPWYPGVAYPNAPGETTGQDPGQINFTPGSVQPGGSYTTPGPGGDTVTVSSPKQPGNAPDITVNPPSQPSQPSQDGNQPSWMTQWPVPQGADPVLWKQIGDAIIAAGGTIGGVGSGPGDIQYYYNTISNAGGWGSYDWAGRIARGIHGTEPSSAGGGGGSRNPAGQTAAYVPGQGVPGMGTVFGPGTPGQNPGMTSDLYNLLSGIATGSRPESANPNYQIDPNDPIIKGQVDAYRTSQTNQLRNELSQLAESAGPNAPIRAQQLSAEEQAAQNVSGYQAGLMANELAARRGEVQQALSGAMGLLTDEQRMQLQEELAQLQIAEGAYQFDTSAANQVGLG